jgi:hypothetical protein
MVQAGYGAFWGEVQPAIHAGLGARPVTNGSSDLDQWAPGFQFLAARLAPSHAYAKPVASGPAWSSVCAFARRPVHADRHGAVVIPPACVTSRGGPRGGRPRGAYPGGGSCPLPMESLIAIAELDSLTGRPRGT